MKRTKRERERERERERVKMTKRERESVCVRGCTYLVANSTPIVLLLSRLNSFLVNLDNKLDFPTPLSPINTTESTQNIQNIRNCDLIYLLRILSN